MTGDSFPCGPIRVRIGSDPHGSARLLRGALDLFGAPWDELGTEVELHLCRPEAITLPTGSAYFASLRMRVESTPQGLAARCDSGANALFDSAAGRWQVGIPTTTDDIWTLTDLENLMSLVVTTGWRSLGWTPFHAGLVCRPRETAGDTAGGPAAMLCAPSGGGKTTLTLALLRRGWSTLGDDKLLVRRAPEGGGMEARALVHTFNLFPHTRRWFPELGEISHLPKYSAWTDKRRVPIARLRPDAPLTRARPSHLIEVVRSDGHSGIKVTPMERGQVLSLLLRQTVIPRHRPTARAILATVAELAGSLTGLHLEVGRDAYLQPDCLDELEAALEADPELPA